MRTDGQSRAFDRDHWAKRKAAVLERVSLWEAVNSVATLKKAGSAAEFVGLCPFHNEKTPSFTVNVRKGLYHCFGCGVTGHNAIDLVMARNGLEFRPALELLESENGLSHFKASRPAPPAPKAEQAEDVGKREAMLRIWGQTVALEAGGIVDRYLRGRCLVPPVLYLPGMLPEENAGWPPDLRYHGALWHPDLKRGIPGMVAAMRRADGSLGAIHRTYLKVTGTSVTKAGTERDKMMLGEPAGTLIRLAPEADKMGGGEGIETSLSAMQLYRRAGFAFGSRANMAAVEPPFVCSDFLYWADRNKAHPDKARSRVGEAAAFKGKAAFGVGRTVAVKVPRLGPGETGDFNDYLVSRMRDQGRGEGLTKSNPSPRSAEKIEVPT